MALISTQYLTGFSALLCVLSAGGCYGWVAPIMIYLLDPESDMYMTSAQAAFMLAIIDIGELFLSVPTGIMADKYGRKLCILITGPIYVLGWVVILLWKSYIVLCAMRIIQGLAMAITFSVVPLYLGEISSSSKRGSITGLFSFAWFCGYFIEYCVGPFCSYQLFTLFTACVPLVFTATFICQPESPYYLLMKEKEAEAMASLQWLRKGCDQDSITDELQEMKETIKIQLTSKSSWKDVVRTPADRRALLIILIIGGTRVMSGAIVLLSYSTNLFKESGTSFLSPDALTIIMGLILTLGSMINPFIVDSLGRRPLLFISFIGCSVSHLTVGTYFFLKDKLAVNISSYSWTVPLGVMVYCLFFVVGMHPISMTYTSELFISKTRGKAASLSTVNLTFWSFVCIELYQIVGDTFGMFIVFWIFAAVCLLGALVLFFLAPETKGKTFSQIRSDILNVK